MYKFKEGYYADIRIEDKFTTTLQYMNDALRECKETVIKKAFIRVYDGKMWYYSSTSDVDNLQGELDLLYENATYNQNIANEPIVKKFEVNKDKKLIFSDSSLRSVPLKTKQALIVNSMPRFSGVEHLKMLQSIYVDRHSVYEFYSSKGANIVFDTQYCGYLFSLSLADGDKNFQNHLVDYTTRFDELTFNNDKADEFVKESLDFLLNAEEAEKGSFPVILSPETAGIFAHESFGHKSEADFMLGNENMKNEWTIGKEIAKPFLSIYDTGSIEGVGYVPYDDEGTKAKMNYLIKDGKLAGRLHSAATAAVLNEELTGNGRAVSTNFEPIVRMTNTVIAEGKDSFEDLVARIQNGYFIKTVKHGSGMSTFTIAPNIAYKIENGRITKPVKIPVITGTVFETLGLIDGLSAKVELGKSIMGGCGKMEQFPLNVNDGGPYVSISKMTIG